MTQPAKVQEPSMEEILASIRRIIADDEAKPPVDKSSSPAVAAKLEKPAAPVPAAKAPVMNNIPPSAIPAAQAAAVKAVPPVKPAPPPPPPPPAAAAVSNSQDDIDAMLAGLDEATSEAEIRPASPKVEVFELTDDMAVPEPPPPQPSFKKVEPQDDLEFSEMAAAKAMHRRPALEPPPFESEAPAPQQILSRSTVSAVESAFNSLANTVLSNNARTLEDLVKEMLRPMLKSWLDDNLPGLVERIVKAEIERVSRGR
jgi:cell pole-organizing protein PopZ